MQGRPNWVALAIRAAWQKTSYKVHRDGVLSSIPKFALPGRMKKFPIPQRGVVLNGLV
jgi:hypothetical protein